MKKDMYFIPLTTTQQLILTGQQLQPDEPLYNMVMVYRIKGRISVDYFKRAFHALVQNCDAMRIVFTDLNTEAKQVVLPSLDTELQVIDFASESDPYTSYVEWQEKRKRLNFDLRKALFDSAIIRLSEDDYIWYINQHHLVTDAWSTEVIYRYMATAYEAVKDNKLDTLPTLPSFADYAIAEPNRRSSKAFARASHYWSERLSTPITDTTFYREIPKTRSSTTLRHKCEFGQARSQGLRALLKEPDLAAFSEDMGLMQLFATILFTYLYRINGHEQLSVGTPCHSRTSAKLKQTAGVLINIFPLQIQIQASDSFLDVYKKVAEANQDLLINAIPGANQATHSHSFDVVLNYLTASFSPFDGNDMRADWVHPDAGDRNHVMRIQVQNFDQQDAITLFFDLHEQAFNEQESAWVQKHFLALADALLGDMNQGITETPLLTRLDEQGINTEQASAIEYASKLAESKHSVLTLLAQSQTQGTQSANSLVIDGEMQVRLDEVIRRSEVLAKQIVSHLGNNGNDKGEGASSEQAPIAIYMDRSIAAVIAVIAVLKAGRAFLPIDVSAPASRVQYILDDAKVKLVLAADDTHQLLIHANQSILLLDSQGQLSTQALSLSAESVELIALPLANARDIAYVIYTSGSTGQPKGVEVTHGGLFNYLSWAKAYYLRGKSFSFPLFSSLSFDLTITSLFLPLISGGRLIIYPQSKDNSAITIRNVIEDNRVDIIKLTPAHLVLIQQMDFSNSVLKALIVGGEDFKTELARVFDKYFAGTIRIFNEYGPTEATVACSVHLFDSQTDVGASLPIGKPINNALMYILDEHLHPVPQGVKGEVYIGGAGLAKAYLHNPSLSAERFIYHPQHPKLRLYKTGDIASFNEQGVIEYHGRNDHQVKVRGVRIETGEIEASLLSLPTIDNCIVDLAERLGLASGEEEHELAVEHCTKCGLAANHPSAQLDHDKVCRICRIYDKQEALAKAYYQDLPTLQAWIDKIKARAKGKQDSIMLLSGGKDSSYTLCKLVDMGLTPLVFFLDNGYISDGAKANIKRLVDTLGLELVVGQTDAMDDILIDSLKRFSNVCNGCFKTIYTMSMQLAKERGISVICTGLSRGQIFETRVAHLFQQGCFSPEKIDERIIEARKAYHRTDDIISRRLDVQVFQDDDVFEQIQYLDYFRYADTTLDEIYDYLNTVAPWIRPSDTGRSTNCLINDVGIYVHKKERGYHNYALPYSWDVRLGHKQRGAALEELNDEIDQEKVDKILTQVGYQYQKPNKRLSREDTLVAYYSGVAEIQKNTLQSHLAKTLPKEYIPSQFIWLEKLPLTPNGKIDREALPKPQQSTRELSVDYIAPSSETETTLAALWGRLLGVREVGTADNFFDLGGDSIVNIQIVAAAREAGIEISPQQVFDYPTIAELAQVAGKVNTIQAEQGLVTGIMPLLPIQAQFFDTVGKGSAQDSHDIHFPNQKNNEFVQALSVHFTKDYSTALLQRAFYALLAHHDGLRSRFIYDEGQWQQEILSEISLDINEINLALDADLDSILSAERERLQQSLDITNGPLMGVSHFFYENKVDENQQDHYLLIVIHHLLVDGVSWWVLLNDLAKACEQLSQQQTVKLTSKSCSLLQWRGAIESYANSVKSQEAREFWLAEIANDSVPSSQKSLCFSAQKSKVTKRLTEEDTALLAQDVPASYSIKTPDVLLAGLSRCIQHINAEISASELLVDDKYLRIDVEGHGREDIVDGLDVTRTVAWFTSIYPITLAVNHQDINQHLLATKEAVRKIPNNGIDYGIFQYLSDDKALREALAKVPKPSILFNYMGQWDRTIASDSPFSFAQAISVHHASDTKNQYLLEVNCMIFEGQLEIAISFDSSLLNEETVSDFATHYKACLKELIAHCISQKGQGLSTSDFPSANLAQTDLEDLLAEFGED